MKKLFYSFRTLCLVAVMCMVSTNALAYEVYDCHTDYCDIVINGNEIVVVESGKQKVLYFCYGFSGNVLIIDANARLTLTGNSAGMGNIVLYLYGSLILEGTNHDLTGAEVYIMNVQTTLSTTQKPFLSGNYSGNPTIHRDVDPSKVGTFEKVAAQVPTADNNHAGWPDYYRQVIYNGDKSDFYPLSYYEDENRTKHIADIDAWKNECSQKWQDLISVKADAIAAIDAAIVGVTDNAVLAIVTQAKKDINAAWSEDVINSVKTKVLADIAFAKAKAEAVAAITTARQGIQNTNIDNWADAAIRDIQSATTIEEVDRIQGQMLDMIQIFQDGKAEALGTMATPCTDCTAIEVTDGTTTVTLYNPTNVGYIKITE